jgi:hypothetical protein
MAEAGNPGFDHIIPVMLADEHGGPPPSFGPLHYKWNEDEVKRACSNVAFILIDSKNFSRATGQDNAVHKCIPTKENFLYFEMQNASPVMFLSIAQDFGPYLKRESLVNIKGRGIEHSEKYRQIRIILKGLGPDTYRCLRENRSTDSTPRNTPTVDEDVGTPMEIDDKESGEDGGKEDEVIGNSDRAEATRFLRLLRLQKLDYLPPDFEDGLRLGSIDNNSLTYCGETPEQDEVEAGWETTTTVR